MRTTLGKADYLTLVVKIVLGFESGDFFTAGGLGSARQRQIFSCLFYCTENTIFKQCWAFLVFQHINLFFLPISYEITVKRKHVRVMMTLLSILWVSVRIGVCNAIAGFVLASVEIVLCYPEIISHYLSHTFSSCSVNRLQHSCNFLGTCNE